MSLLEHEAAATDMQLCCSSWELRFPSRLATLLLAGCGGWITLSRQLSLIALPEPRDDFGMVKNLVS